MYIYIYMCLYMHMINCIYIYIYIHTYIWPGLRLATFRILTALFAALFATFEDHMN